MLAVTLNPLNPGPQKWFKLEDMFRDTLGLNLGDGLVIMFLLDIKFLTIRKDERF